MNSKDNVKPCTISVALNVCNGLYGLIQTGKDGYMITPVDNNIHHIDAEHELIRVNPILRNEIVPKSHISKRDVEGESHDRIQEVHSYICRFK